VFIIKPLPFTAIFPNRNKRQRFYFNNIKIASIQKRSPKRFLSRRISSFTADTPFNPANVLFDRRSR